MLLICSALEEEASIVDSIFKNIEPGISRFTDKLILGMGPQVASTTIKNYIEKKGPPGLVVLFGYAGGLDPKLESGDVVVEISSPKNNLPNFSDIYDRQCKVGSFFAQDAIASTPEEKKKLFEITKCDAVDMESSSLTQVCASYGISVIIIKAISDTQTTRLPVDFSKFMQERGRVKLISLILHIITHPWIIPGMLNLASANKKCKDQLSFRLGILLPILAKSLNEPSN